MWKKLHCKLFGHRWQVAEGDHPADIGAGRYCACGAHIVSVTWERTSEQWVQAAEAAGRARNVYRLPKPVRPAPPMPTCKPPAPAAPPARVRRDDHHPMGD